MNKIVIPVSYMGSGSSAITDLISEFDGYVAPMGSDELILMHYPNGVFDLEDKLLLANNALRSDEAIRSFEKAMAELNDTKFWWAGNYKKSVTRNFCQYVEEYVDGLTQYELDAFWYMQEKPTLCILMKRMLGRIMRLISFNRIVLKRPLRYKNMKISFIQADEFYVYSKEFMIKIFNDLGLREHNLILDQLFTQFDIHRCSRYFADNIECLVVDRDPRDVFLLNKYVWKPVDNPVPYPTDVEKFVKYYKSIREMGQKYETEYIHLIHFEDMVYKYDETLKQIKDILKIEEGQHSNPKGCFNPEKSIDNTQIFLDDRYREETLIIERQLPEYLYKFPYERKADTKNSY